MIVEQLRYYVNDQDREQLILARRQVNRVRSELGLPPGKILLADSGLEEGPSLIWQCSYEDESHMAAVEVSLIGNSEYEAARNRVSGLATRVELELYTFDEEEIASSEVRRDA